MNSTAAELAMYGPDESEPYARLTGHEQIVLIVDAMRSRYVRTMHVLSNSLIDVGERTGDPGP